MGLIGYKVRFTQFFLFFSLLRFYYLLFLWTFQKNLIFKKQCLLMCYSSEAVSVLLKWPIYRILSKIIYTLSTGMLISLWKHCGPFYYHFIYILHLISIKQTLLSPWAQTRLHYFGPILFCWLVLTSQTYIKTQVNKLKRQIKR